MSRVRAHYKPKQRRVVREHRRTSRFACPGMPNLKMDDEVYKLRRKVINLVYDAKGLVPNLPRINVRITGERGEEHKKSLGVGSKSRTAIWIPECSFGLEGNDLRYVVFHEIGHAVFGSPHRSDGGLMEPTVQKGWSKARIDRAFKEEAVKQGWL